MVSLFCLNVVYALEVLQGASAGPVSSTRGKFEIDRPGSSRPSLSWTTSNGLPFQVPAVLMHQGRVVKRGTKSGDLTWDFNGFDTSDVRNKHKMLQVAAEVPLTYDVSGAEESAANGRYTYVEMQSVSGRMRPVWRSAQNYYLHAQASGDEDEWVLAKDSRASGAARCPDADLHTHGAAPQAGAFTAVGKSAPVKCNDGLTYAGGAVKCSADGWSHDEHPVEGGCRAAPPWAPREPVSLDVVLQRAKPDWSTSTRTSVRAKLRKVRVTTEAELKKAIEADELNDALRDADERTFGASTLLALYIQCQDDPVLAQKISEAKPDYGVKTMVTVLEKLWDVDVRSVAELKAKLASNSLNRALRDKGHRGFGPETLRDISAALEVSASLAELPSFAELEAELAAGRERVVQRSSAGMAFLPPASWGATRLRAGQAVTYHTLSEVYFGAGQVHQSAVCGASLFSQPSLQCSAGHRAPSAAQFAGVPDRGFGVELEMVGRSPRGGRGGFFVELASTQNSSSEASLEMEDGDLAGLKSCMTQKAGRSIDNWNWITDCTVKPLKEAEARQLGSSSPSSETSGVAFELVSAPPPHALTGATGIQSAFEVVSLLHAMGVQAGPTQGMHVHVNVGKPGQSQTPGAGAGRSLSMAEIGNVYAHFARYTHVTDEMLQDSRVNNRWSKGLHFHEQIVNVAETGYGGAPQIQSGLTRTSGGSRDVPKFFKRIHKWVKGAVGRQDDSKFCNWVNGGYLSGYSGENYDSYPSQPCDQRYPNERYHNINLIVLNRYGTIEFRAFPASSDAQRVTSWIRFVLKFVDSFKDRHEFLRDGHDDPEVAALELEHAQTAASLEGLAQEVGMSAEDLQLWKRKPWEQGPACQVGGASALELGAGELSAEPLEEPEPQELSMELEPPRAWDGTPYTSEWSHAEPQELLRVEHGGQTSEMEVGATARTVRRQPNQI